MATPDQLEFIREVLRSAPAGNFNALLEDMQKLAGSSVPDDAWAEIKSHHERDTCAATQEDLSHPLAALLKQELNKYQEGLYSGGKDVISRGEISAGSNNDEVVLRTYAERVDEAKSRTGFWSAEWTIKSDASTAEISGKLKICSFSFEGGNFQLRSTREFAPKTVEGELAPAIMKQIASWENEAFVSLMDSYAQSTHSLKSIRGILPVTHTRLNWNVVVHRTARTLQDTVQK
ncbi:capping protein (actin filament) muscle Z-line, alpha [Seminavis robusta]|uniref:F-actin-capping protein subunit alpha n=1 Tax=Seminavis robusta TaxID=568900 RepID=A0A9N8H4V1_9STRA|nr:capping protein (actin filament) muscle Z-line, alpha [Seminavis robusta]|eukprot:Sro124_g059920.1 capping protein (actin filament) muscle Z-line, alpha (233) ;mRNA; r:61789-62487